MTISQLKRPSQNPEIRASVKEEAKKRAKNTLMLWEVGKAEEIQVTDDDVAAHQKSFRKRRRLFSGN